MGGECVVGPAEEIPTNNINNLRVKQGHAAPLDALGF
jgi:hypothetical protein